MAVIDTFTSRIMEGISFDRVAEVYDKTRGLPSAIMKKNSSKHS